MTAIRHCPKCGKVMAEQRGWHGLWMCPDYSVPLNDAPPFEFKCNGMELTEQAVIDLEKEIGRVIAESN